MYRLTERHEEKITVTRETKGDACVLPECEQSTMEENNLGRVDVFRVRGRCGARVQRSHRRTLSTDSDGARNVWASQERRRCTL